MEWLNLEILAIKNILLMLCAVFSFTFCWTMIGQNIFGHEQPALKRGKT
jgi:hypothetical protein